jgi:hypothetical protein
VLFQNVRGCVGAGLAPQGFLKYVLKIFQGSLVEKNVSEIQLDFVVVRGLIRHEDCIRG